MQKNSVRTFYREIHLNVKFSFLKVYQYPLNSQHDDDSDDGGHGDDDEIGEDDDDGNEDDDDGVI